MHTGALQVGAGQGCQFRLNFKGQHACAPARQQRGHVARACADLKHALVGLHLQVLQQARFHARGQHAFAVAQGDFQVGKGQCLVRRWHKVFAWHFGQQGQDVGVEHVPGPDLLLDHVESGLGDVAEVHTAACFGK